MARADRGCCCSGGGGSGEDECCGESPNCSTPPANKYHKISIGMRFANKYQTGWTWSPTIPAGVFCEQQGGEYPATTTISQTYKLGNWAGLQTRSLQPCGGTTQCMNGKTIPGTNPPETVPGSCPSSASHGCVTVCYPYDWRVCCAAPGTQPNCGDLSISALDKFQNTFSVARANITVKAQASNGSPLTIYNSGIVSSATGCPGFIQATAPSSIIPTSWYLTNTETQEVKWGFENTSSNCPSGYTCHFQSIDFYCADAVRAEHSGYPDVYLRYFTAGGQFLSSPPSSSLTRYIDLEDYPGAIIAVLDITHSTLTDDELILDNGWGDCGWQSDGESLGAVNVKIGFVAICGATSYQFYPFGHEGVISSDGTMMSSAAASSFTIPHDTDDWSN